MVRLIGILGGTFDPIHFGHLNLAVAMMETHSLFQVWFCPAAQNPLKSTTINASAGHRMHMVRLAIEREPRFKVIDTDITREGPSYAIDTLQAIGALKPTGNDTKYALILGEDAAKDFFLWREPDKIAEYVQLLTGSRYVHPEESALKGSELVVEALQKGWTRISLMEISSTEVRKRLFDRKYCGHLVPGKVLDYIEEYCLYYEGNSNDQAR